MYFHIKKASILVSISIFLPMTFYYQIKDHLKSLLDLVYPVPCQACGVTLLDNEKQLCVFCEIDLFIPRDVSKNQDLPLARFSEQPIELVVGLMRFQKKGHSQTLLNKIKYQAEISLGNYLGERLGEKILGEIAVKDIDFIIPVPLHKKKLSARGFNQAEIIAEGISEIIKKPLLTHILLKTRNNSTQTKKRRLSRWKNTDMIFALNDSLRQIEGKNILLIDDVLTSGATITGCTKQLKKSKAKNIYIGVLAISG
jgi:ComF family protein